MTMRIQKHLRENPNTGKLEKTYLVRKSNHIRSKDWHHVTYVPVTEFHKNTDEMTKYVEAYLERKTDEMTKYVEACE